MGSRGFLIGLPVILSGLLAVLGSLGFARFGYSMILPGMKEGLGLTYTEVGIMESANFLGYMAFAIAGSLLAWRYGPRVVIASSLSVVGASMLMTGLSQSFLQALVARGATGLGAGGANVPAMMLPAAWLPAKRRGLASGLIAAGSGIGIVLTGISVPAVNAVYGSEGWRLSWLILGAATLIFAAVCWGLIRDPPGPGDELRGSRALGLKGVATDPVLWRVGVIYLLFGFSYIIYVTFFGAYLVIEVSLPAQSAGGLWALEGALSLECGPLWGHVSDRAGRQVGLAAVFSIHALSFSLFALKSYMMALYVSVILFGMTAWSIPSIMAAYSGDHFARRYAFSAFGLLTLFFGLGQVLGPSAAGLVADLSSTLTRPLLLSSAASSLGAVLSLTVLRKERV
ncbi:MAG: YbfB/YjiJ family MFS transporter [Candidatus Bathyarchaeia archaeon]